MSIEQNHQSYKSEKFNEVSIKYPNQSKVSFLLHSPLSLILITCGKVTLTSKKTFFAASILFAKAPSSNLISYICWDFIEESGSSQRICGLNILPKKLRFGRGKKQSNSFLKIKNCYCSSYFNLNCGVQLQIASCPQFLIVRSIRSAISTRGEMIHSPRFTQSISFSQKVSHSKGKAANINIVHFLFCQSFKFLRRFDTAELPKQLLGVANL